MNNKCETCGVKFMGIFALKTSKNHKCGIFSFIRRRTTRANQRLIEMENIIMEQEKEWLNDIKERLESC